MGPAITASPAAATSGLSTGTVTTSAEGVIQDPNLPHPFQYPDTGTPKPGGTVRMGTSYAVSIFDPAKTSAGGTLMITNFAYNRLLGFPRGQEMDPLASSSHLSSPGRGSVVRTA